MTHALAFILGFSLLGGLGGGEKTKPAEPKPVEAAQPVEAVQPAKPAQPAPKETAQAEKKPAVVTVSRPGGTAKAKKAKTPAAEKDKAKKAFSGPRSVRITSQRTDYDRKEGVIMFDREVFVDDPEYKMHADQLYVFLDGTNDLRRIVALGNVAITNEMRSGVCAKASFTKALNRIVMYGDGTNVLARLRDAGKKKTEVCGRKITFWIDSEQVEVEGSEVLLDAGGIGGKGGAKKLLGK